MNTYQGLNFFYGLPIKIEIRMKIPRIYWEQPIIYNLAYGYNLDVKILSGNLGSDNNNDGDFHLELTGIKERIAEGIKYLSSLNINFSQYQLQGE
jgi:ABC-type methionine transport system ATPase subunit